jgi:hypothetical protein
VWKLKLPPKIHFFLWLVVHNKILTRDNIVKRQNIDDLTCVFCNEPGTCNHILFDCVVARVMWDEVKNLVDSNSAMVDTESVANLWDGGKTNIALNVVHATMLFYG